MKPLILSLETSTNICSVALNRGDEHLANISLHIDKSHSGSLAPLIKSTLDYCGNSVNDLSVVAISKGPGSYTGLRIGTSVAKGLCDALNLPLIAVNTLEAMALGQSYTNWTDALLCPMIDARRMEVYYSLLNNKLEIIQYAQPKIIDENSFSAELANSQILFFGNGAGKCQDVIKSNNAVFLKNVFPDATHVGALAYKKFINNEFEDLAYFEPFYLKEFKVTKPKAI